MTKSQMHRVLSILGVLIALTASFTAQAQVPPANDDFVNAEVLPTDTTWLGSNVDATAEPGEPSHAGVSTGSSIWFEWTAPTDGFVTVDTFGSNYDTVLALYIGTAVDALTVVASNDDAPGWLQSELYLIPVGVGTVYSLAVDGYSAAQGNVTLNVSFWDGTDTAPPTITIDTPWEGAVFVEGAVVPASYSCEDPPPGASGVATCIGDIPVGEPIDTLGQGPHQFTVSATDVDGNASSATVNYTVSGTDVTPPSVTLTAPADDAVFVQGAAIAAAYSCFDEPFGSGIATCVGDLPSGSLIDTSLIGSFTFTVTGTDNSGNATSVVANYTIIDALPNDNFADAQPLAQDDTWVGTNVTATVETGEPRHGGAGGFASIWFQWTAPMDGYLTVDTFGSNFDTVLAMYTGTAVDALTLVFANDDWGGPQSRMGDVPVTAGTVYHIAADG
ncbi:MAG: hypothetical protein OES25_16755, partial [Acidobacteriota bacterium]|nr:hypothetical protein [Acidobacteriota bacterium]